ncbi:uncharacterized protein TrAtP1_003288 [Trichoderma atroviride]|uniref:uncharacterized protein n=1 Tax=Hypocrea atroviridis TaxID=63577 RepID=UPI00331A0589|nr:hypothetical protein TrAtP1_003288 [Trichoderma atroviride]
MGTAEFRTKCGQIYCAVYVRPLSMVAVTAMSSFPRSALTRFRQPALTPFGMSESKTSYSKFLEFCKNDFTSSQVYSILLILGFLLSMMLVVGADRLHSLSPRLHHYSNKKDMNCPPQESNLGLQ